MRRLLAVFRYDATLVIKECRSENLWCMEETGSVKCSPDWQLYITARSVYISVSREVEKKDTRPALPSDFWQHFPMSAAHANSRDDALAHVLPVRASRARDEEPLTYDIILWNDPGKERR